MKYTIVIAALLGLMSQNEVTAIARKSFPGVTFIETAAESDSDDDENV
jgi:hypothetical protein